MKFRKLGASGIDASVVAFGAWAIGGWKWGGTDAKQSIAAIHAALDSGINFIDTAAVYGFGFSEELVGKALEGVDRSKVIVASKCGLRWDIESPTLHAQSEGKSIYRSLNKESIMWEVEQSLQRLKTDYIDLYQTHWPDPSTPPEDVMQTLLELKEQGKVRAVGFCNAELAHLEGAAKVAPMDTDQERYSLLDRERDSDNLPYCEKNALAFLAYSPIAQGLLSAKMDPGRTFGEGDLRIGNPRFSNENRQAINDLLAPVSALAAESGHTVEQLVLAWTLLQPGMTHVLVGARNTEQAISNAKTGSLVLDDEQYKIVDTAAAAWSGF